MVLTSILSAEQLVHPWASATGAGWGRGHPWIFADKVEEGLLVLYLVLFFPLPSPSGNFFADVLRVHLKFFQVANPASYSLFSVNGKDNVMWVQC